MPRYNDFYSMNLGELQSEVLRRLWINPVEDDNGWPAETAFAKYSEYRLNRKINQYYNDLVVTSRALRGWFILPLTANYTQYPIPLGFYDIDEAYLFTSATSYTKLDVYEASQIEELLSPGWMTVTGSPEYVYIGDRNLFEPMIGFAPVPATSATAVTVATGGDTVTRPLGEVDAVTGVAGVDSSTYDYVDSQGQDLGYLVAGIVILNITADTVGTISSISTTNTDNDTLTCSITWTAGDEMRILGSAVTATISITDQDASYILNPTLGSLPQPGITMAANNVLVRGFKRPVKLSSKYQYPQLSSEFHSAIVLGAAADLGKNEPVDVPEYKQALMYEEQYNIAVAKLTGMVAAQYHTSSRIISRRR